MDLQEHTRNDRFCTCHPTHARCSEPVRRRYTEHRGPTRRCCRSLCSLRSIRRSCRSGGAKQSLPGMSFGERSPRKERDRHARSIPHIGCHIYIYILYVYVIQLRWFGTLDSCIVTPLGQNRFLKAPKNQTTRLPVRVSTTFLRNRT